MPKPRNFKPLFNDMLRLYTSRLKKWGYFKPGQMKNGTIEWSRNGIPFSIISIFSDFQNEQPYIEVKYNCNDKLKNYIIKLTPQKSNLNRGEIWLFVCPVTNKHCRILYLYNGMFMHREAIKDCMYESQTYSKYYRQMDKTLGAYFKIDKHYESLHKKHFKKTYAGKPTKRYARIKREIAKGECISIEELLLSKASIFKRKKIKRK